MEAKILAPPDSRTIYWICNREGNTGKTTHFKYWEYKGHLKIMPYLTKPDQVLQYVFANGGHKCHGINIGKGVGYRSEAGKEESQQFRAACESFRDCLAYDWKNQGLDRTLDRPHVLFMANCPPLLGRGIL